MVNYLNSPLGVLTYYNDTNLYNYFYGKYGNYTYIFRNNEITNEGSKFLANFPTNSLYLSIQKRGGVVTDGFINMLNSFFPNTVYKDNQDAPDQTYEFYNNAGRYVKTTSNVRKTPLNNGVDDIYGYIGSSNNGFVYGGIVKYDSGSTGLDEASFSIIIFNDDYSEYLILGFGAYYTSSTKSIWVTKSYLANSQYNTAFIDFFKNASPDPRPPEEDTDPYAKIDGEGNIPGGGSVGIPNFPSLTATSTGIIGLFAPSPSQMQQLADYMWTDFGGTGQDVTEVLKEIVEALKRAISNPLDYVIGLNIIPSQGLSIGDSSVIKFGFTSTNVSMPRLSNQYFTVDCGSISFPPLCGDTFLDYAPYSKFSIYLPYIGVKDVDANDFVGHTIGVIYHGDTVTGGVTAYITKDGSVMYQYSGCCALNIPLSSDNWGNTISGAVQIATSLITAGATGGAAGVAMAAAKGAASVAANPSLLSPQVSHSGAVSGGAGCMAVQYPFVIREAVRFHSTAGFNKFSGYPSYYNRSLGDVSGFTTVLDVHLENVPATSVEISEIENLLKSGVIL